MTSQCSQRTKIICVLYVRRFRICPSDIYYLYLFCSVTLPLPCNLHFLHVKLCKVSCLYHSGTTEQCELWSHNVVSIITANFKEGSAHSLPLFLLQNNTKKYFHYGHQGGENQTIHFFFSLSTFNNIKSSYRENNPNFFILLLVLY